MGSILGTRRQRFPTCPAPPTTMSSETGSAPPLPPQHPPPPPATPRRPRTPPRRADAGFDARAALECEHRCRSDGAQPHLVNIQFQKKVQLEVLASVDMLFLLACLIHGIHD